MTKAEKSTKKLLLIIFAALVTIVTVVSIFFYNNFNRLLSDTLMSSFHSSILSDVYELKFEKLSVNLLKGDIQVYNVSIMPRDTHSQQYPYINSFVKFKTHKLALKNVQLKMLVQFKELKLDSIEIDRPDIELILAGRKNTFLPFADTTKVDQKDAEKLKRSVLSFLLKKLNLTEASFHVDNRGRQRRLEIENLNIGVHELNLDQRTGENFMTSKSIDLYVGTCKANMKKGPFQEMQFKDFRINIDSIEIQNTIDTTMFHFSQFNAGLNALDVLTADSIYNVRMDSFKLSYRDKSILVGKAELKQNISKSEMQSAFKYQHLQLSGTVGSLKAVNVNFDSLIHHNSIVIDEILAKNAKVNVYKDKTKPLNLNRFPEYLGQELASVEIPLTVKSLKATNVHVVSTEKKEDGKIAVVEVTRINATVENITNQSKAKDLVVRGEAYLADKVHFKSTMAFSYTKPQVAFDVRFGQFNFKDLDAIITQFTPANIENGMVDDLHFYGTAFDTYASGTMQFLFHDLVIDLKLKEEAAWANNIVAFAANTILSKDNPASENVPPRIVQFRADRNRNKAFINILLLSAVAGMKETIIMSKENKKDYRKAKKEARQEKRQN